MESGVESGDVTKTDEKSSETADTTSPAGEVTTSPAVESVTAAGDSGSTPLEADVENAGPPATSSSVSVEDTSAKEEAQESNSSPEPAAEATSEDATSAEAASAKAASAEAVSTEAASAEEDDDGITSDVEQNVADTPVDAPATDAVQESEEKSQDDAEEISQDGVEETSQDNVEETSQDGVEETSQDGIEETSQDGVEETSQDGVEETSQDGVEETSQDWVEESSQDGVVEKLPDEEPEAKSPDGVDAEPVEGETQDDKETDEEEEDDVNLLSDVDNKSADEVPASEGDALLKESQDDSQDESVGASAAQTEATTDEDALLKEDKVSGGETQASQEITAAEEEELLKDADDGEKMDDDDGDDEEAMEVEESGAGSQVKQAGYAAKPEDEDVESMDVDDGPKDVEMQSEPGSVTQEVEQDEERKMDSETVSKDVLSEGKQDEDDSEPSSETKDDDPASEAKDDEPTSEAKVEDALNETKDDEPSSEAKDDEPSGEAKEDEPSSETKDNKASSETKDDEPSSEAKEDAIKSTVDKTVAEEEGNDKSGATDKKSDDENVGEGSVETATTEAGKESGMVTETAKDAEDDTSKSAEESKPDKSDDKTSDGDVTETEKAKDVETSPGDSTEVDAAKDSNTTEESSTKEASEAIEDADEGSSSRDASKSPITAGKAAVAKKGKIGFSLGNIVSQLKKKCEKAAEKDDSMEGVEEGDTESTTVTTPTTPTKEKAPETTTDDKESAEKGNDVTSPNKDTPSGSSRRKQGKVTAQREKDASKDDDDDDDIVEIVSGPSNENEGQMKNYATDTMNELLGMFGFDKVDQQESQSLKLSDNFSAKAPPASAAAAPAPAAKAGSKPTAAASKTKEAPTKGAEKKVHCTECKQPITSTTNLGWGSQPFCSPTCLTNFQNRQTSVCEYCNGLISQAVRDKFTKEMQTGMRKEFCSQGCVSEFTKRLKTCTHCAKEVKATEMIVAPVGAQNKFKEFCNQGCVDAYELKRQVLLKSSSKSALHPCAVCKKNAKVKHEINFQNNIHRLCSNDCFGKFRTKHALALNFCEQCGVICYNENLVPNVLLGGKMRRFCSQRCLGEYKVKNRRQVPCSTCMKPSTNHNMIEESGPGGETRLFCSLSCLQKPRVKTKQAPASITRSGTQAAPAPAKAQASTGTGAGVQPASQSAPCNHCRKNQRPLYHLTMSDNTIRNFCSYPCVIAFQAQFNVPPVTLPQETLMLKCGFCSTGFIHKPLTLEYKGTISLFCTQGCFDEFKRSNSVVVECDYCHLEKVLHDRSFFSGMAKSFCSEGCKLLFKQQFAQRLGLKCIVCDYCAQTCRSTVEMVYNKTRRRFCGIACRDKYDKWFNKTARCDGCKLMGRTLSETFMWRDEIKKVCDQKCLLLFYTQQNIPNMTTQGQIPIGPGGAAPQPGAQPGAKGGQPAVQQTSTPVIANVMSLASLNNQQQQNVVKTVYRPPVQVARATKQTQITTAPPKIKPPPPPPAPLPPAPKMMRNKITLCKPFTQTKSVSCRPVHQDKTCQTDGPRQIFVPIPVPIFIPVPMHMYTTPVPYPIGINTPVPVPMFIPVAAGNADRLIKTIKEIREKTPSDPLEAELLMMAAAVADDDKEDDKDSSSPTLPDIDVSSFHEGSSKDKEEPTDDVSSMTLEEAEDIIPSDILAENILQMAAEMTNVLVEDQDLQDDISVLLAPDRPATPPKPKGKPRPKRRGRGGRNKRYIVDESDEESTAQAEQSAVAALIKSKDDAKKSVGINAFKHFIQGKLNAMSEKERKRNKMLRPDVLDCATEELYFGLGMFVKEARNFNGEKFSPDMLLLMFLSIQRELFDNERPENIFTDFEQFTTLVHKEVKDWQPIMDPVSDLVTNSLVDEESLWNSKQLGAHSPYILLSTLLYFNTKCFRLNGVEQHKELAFVRVQKHLRKNEGGRTMYLRYFPKEMMKKLQGTEGGKRKRERDETLELPEQCENTDNPLRCPVKLYEFYLSKCPESVKTRTDLFYLVPERSCIPDSPVWYTCQPLPDKDMNHILSRIWLTKDIHETWAAAANREEDDYIESD